MSEREHDEIERRRETNEGAHPYRGDLTDEHGDFAVRVVYQSDCEERIASTHSSLRVALSVADGLRADLSAPIRAKGLNPRARVYVGVIDLGNPERGSLDWEVLG